MKVIFLDIDGVLNQHRFQKGAALIDPGCVARLNKIISETDARIVVHSAWRYMVLERSMTVDGFAHMLATHGIDIYTGPGQHRMLDVTRLDRDQTDEDRTAQITEWAKFYGCTDWIAIDDRPLQLPCSRFVLTTSSVGLTDEHVDLAISMLGKVEQSITL